MAKRKPDDMRFVDQHVNHWEGTAQLEAGPAPTREELFRSLQNMYRRVNAEMVQSMGVNIFYPDQMQSPPLIGGRSSGRSRLIPMEDMLTHDITIGHQRRIIGPFIARPFAKIIPDSHRSSIFDNAKWVQVESALNAIDRSGRDEFFEITGKLYVESWKRLWKKTREEAEALLEKKNPT